MLAFRKSLSLVTGVGGGILLIIILSSVDFKTIKIVYKLNFNDQTENHNMYIISSILTIELS